MITIILLGIIALCAFDLMVSQYQQEPYPALFWGAMVLALAGWIVIDSLIILAGNLRDIWRLTKRESITKVSIPAHKNQEQATVTPSRMV
jgi:hypothetical protein